MEASRVFTATCSNDDQILVNEKLVIVSADEIILYQPTLLNLYEFLRKEFDITIITFEPDYLGKEKDTKRNILYIRPGKLKKTIFRFIDLVLNAMAKRVDKYVGSFKHRSIILKKYKAGLLAKTIEGFKEYIFIAVDLMPLYVVQQQVGAAHFLSLEIIPGDTYLKKIDTNKIISVVIQSEIRYRYLFNEHPIPTFYIQNAPMLNSKVLSDRDRTGFIWAGTVVKEFGVVSCFDFIEAYPQHSLVCKGAVEKKTKAFIEKKYVHLLSAKKVVLDTDYLPADKFIEYLSGFRIGFCFYSWELIHQNFNYQTAPSGKLFMYLAAGVPVVAANISAFKFIETAGAGILVDDYSPSTLQAAITKIEADYELFSKNCYKAFEENCFDKNAVLYREFLLKIS